MAVAAAVRRCIAGSRPRVVAAVAVMALAVLVPVTAASAGEDPGDSETGQDLQANCADEVADQQSRDEGAATRTPLDCVLDTCEDREGWWLLGEEEGPSQWVEEWKQVCLQARRDAEEYETAREDGVVWLDSAACEWLSVLDVVWLAADTNPRDENGASPREWCYRQQRQEAYEVLESGSATRVSISCTYSTPIGSSTAGIGREDDADSDSPAQDADAATHSVGYVQDVLQVMGWQRRMNMEIDASAPEWWKREVLLNHECHLATRYPTVCVPLEDRASRSADAPDTQPMGEPVPATDASGGRYNPRTDGRTPWQPRSLLPDPCVGDYPSAQYDIGYSTDGFVDIDDTVLGVLTNTFFSFGKGAMQVSFTFVNYAYDFDLVNGLGSVVDRAASMYEAQVVGGMHLADIAWLAFVGWIAFLLVTRRFTLAAGEALVSLVFLALFTTMLQSPRAYMEGASGTMNEVSASVLRADCADGETNPRVVERRCSVTGQSRIQRDLHRFFVHEPYLYVNWGWDDEIAANCEERVAHILQTGPHGGHDWPRLHMARGGGECGRAAQFNEMPTWDRLFMALLAGVMATVVAAVLAAMGLTVLLAKFVVAMLFAVAPIALALAVLPAGGRRLATAWMTTLLQAIVVSVGMSIVLSLLMIALEGMGDAVDGLTLVERWIVIVVVLVMVWYARKRFLTTMQQVAGHIGDRLARPDLANGNGGGFGGGGYGGGGFRPAGGSMFGATRMNGAEVFNLGMSALTAASTAGALGMTAGRVTMRAASAPIRQGGKVMSLRRQSNRILRNNTALVPLNRSMDQVFDTLSAGGGAAGAGAPAGAAGLVAQNAEALTWQRASLAVDTRHGMKVRRQKFGWYDDDGTLVEMGTHHRREDRRTRRENAGGRLRGWFTAEGMRTAREAIVDRGPIGYAIRVKQRLRNQSWDHTRLGNTWHPTDFHPPERVHVQKVRERRGIRQAIRHQGPVPSLAQHLGTAPLPPDVDLPGDLPGGGPPGAGAPGGSASGGAPPGGSGGSGRGGSSGGGRRVINVPPRADPGDVWVAGAGRPAGGSAGEGRSGSPPPSGGPRAPVRLGPMDNMRLRVGRLLDVFRRS
jgi:uncharacterized membrane protein YgcG